MRMIGIAASSKLGVYDENGLVLDQFHFFSDKIRLSFIGNHLRDSGFFGSKIVNHPPAFKLLIAIFEFRFACEVASTI